MSCLGHPFACSPVPALPDRARTGRPSGEIGEIGDRLRITLTWRLAAAGLMARWLECHAGGAGGGLSLEQCPAHVWGTPDPLLSGEFPPPGVIANWAEWLQAEEEALTMHLRRQTHTGRPCGSEAFLEALEHLLARPVQPQKRGRKTREALKGGNS